MHVWVFQHVADGLALASGDTHADPMFSSSAGRRWRVPTALDPKSKPFELDKPAVAMAIALLDDGAEILEWSQAVTIATESPFPGRDPS